MVSIEQQQSLVYFKAKEFNFILTYTLPFNLTLYIQLFDGFAEYTFNLVTPNRKCVNKNIIINNYSNLLINSSLESRNYIFCQNQWFFI